MGRTLFILLIVCTSIVCGDDIQMSVNDLHLAIKTEHKIIDNLRAFIQDNCTESNNQKIQRFIEDFQYLTGNIDEDGFDDPVHAYLLMRHMAVDYKKMLKYVNSNRTKEFLQNLTSSVKTQLPNIKDVEDAALSLVRIQSVYDIGVRSVISGTMMDNNKSTSYNVTLTAEDSLRLGSQALLAMNLTLAVEWFEEGLTRSDLEKVDNDTINAAKTQYDAIQNILNYGGSWFENLMSTAVSNAPSYLLDFSNFIPGLPSNFFNKVKASAVSEGHKKYKKEYKQLCQGKSILEPEKEKALICAYVTGAHPRLILSPNKIEVLSYDPVVVIYHDIMTDKEIEYIKKLSEDKLKPTITKKSNDFEEQVSFARTGKMAFLDENPKLQLLSNRVQHVTGIDVYYAEDWQVVNYGIGGHYEVHHDYFSFDEKNITSYGGDRLATMLFYLNDVKSGGNTVFPVLKVGAKPKKGSALFWYNLYRNGQGNQQSLHAACPIISGTKWVSNKWLHAHGNEFTRKCSIDSSE